MRDVAKIPPKWAPSERELRAEAMRNAFSLSRSWVAMAQLPMGRARLRAIDPYYCQHPKLIPIWKYKRFPEKVF
jgi:hypothetical protein